MEIGQELLFGCFATILSAAVLKDKNLTFYNRSYVREKKRKTNTFLFRFLQHVTELVLLSFSVLSVSHTSELLSFCSAPDELIQKIEDVCKFKTPIIKTKNPS